MEIASSLPISNVKEDKLKGSGTEEEDTIYNVSMNWCQTDLTITLKSKTCNRHQRRLRLTQSKTSEKQSLNKAFKTASNYKELYL